MEWYDKVAKKYNKGIDSNMLPLILEGLSRNNKLYGARYCPCRLNRDKDTVCPCAEFRDTKHCHCGLFIDKPES